MKDFTEKKNEIRARMASKMMSPRQKQIQEINSRNEMEGKAMTVKQRWLRRHHGVKGTTKAEREDTRKLMSKDVGAKKVY